MRRKITLAVLILLCFLAQTTLFGPLEIGSTAPNLMLILTVSFGFMQGKKEGLMIGFFCGLLMDIFYREAIGVDALIYMYLGYASGFLCKVYFDEDIKVPVLLVTAADFIYGIAVFISSFLMRGRTDFIGYTGSVILPEIVYTVLVGIVLYRLFYWINKQLVKRESRGKMSLWLRN